MKKYRHTGSVVVKLCTSNLDAYKHWLIQGGQPGHSPQAKEGGHHVVCPPPRSSQKYYIYFYFLSKVNLDTSSPKNSGLTSWSFQFWGYPRLGPRPKLPPPPKTGGWIRQCL